MINKIVITPGLLALMAGDGHWNSFKPPPIATKRTRPGQGASHNRLQIKIKGLANSGQIALLFMQRKGFKISNIDIPRETLKARISLSHPNLLLPI